MNLNGADRDFDKHSESNTYDKINSGITRIMAQLMNPAMSKSTKKEGGSSISVGARVLGVFAVEGESSGTTYPATVAEVHDGGAEYTLNWEDGDRGRRRQPAANVRKEWSPQLAVAAAAGRELVARTMEALGANGLDVKPRADMAREHYEKTFSPLVDWTRMRVAPPSFSEACDWAPETQQTSPFGGHQLIFPTLLWYLHKHVRAQHTRTQLKRNSYPCNKLQCRGMSEMYCWTSRGIVVCYFTSFVLPEVLTPSCLVISIQAYWCAPTEVDHDLIVQGGTELADILSTLTPAVATIGANRIADEIANELMPGHVVILHPRQDDKLQYRIMGSGGLLHTPTANSALVFLLECYENNNVRKVRMFATFENTLLSKKHAELAMTEPCEPSELIHCRLRLLRSPQKVQQYEKLFLFGYTCAWPWGTLSHVSVEHDDNLAYGRLLNAGHLSVGTAATFIRAVSICPSLRKQAHEAPAAAETSPAAAEKETVVEEPGRLSTEARPPSRLKPRFTPHSALRL